jgi:hypothetical protein
MTAVEKFDILIHQLGYQGEGQATCKMCNWILMASADRYRRELGMVKLPSDRQMTVI